jgi:hypothetical protein
LVVKRRQSEDNKLFRDGQTGGGGDDEADAIFGDDPKEESGAHEPMGQRLGEEEHNGWDNIIGE